MHNVLVFLLVFNSIVCFSQNELIPTEKLKEDLLIFKSIREQANSGLYKYRTKNQLDSLFNWAFNEIKEPKTLIDFYKIICKITDFEGSTHNDTHFPAEFNEIIKAETGYFPYPIKLIQNKTLINIENNEIPLGSEIHKINGKEIKQIIENFYKFYTTDGYNITGKTIGINRFFGEYYRLEYGPEEKFEIAYSLPNETEVKTTSIKSVSNKLGKENFLNRHSKPIDSLFYGSIKKNKYYFEVLNKTTVLLVINTFLIGGNSSDIEHKRYKKYLDSCFYYLKQNIDLKNLIVDIRNNGGGSDPNDILTYSYLTNNKFRENKRAYINFHKIPMTSHLVPEESSPKEEEKAQKSFEKELRKEFPHQVANEFYQSAKFNKYIKPQKNAFKGNIYLLISPRVASAGSLFASLLEGNTNAISIGEETMGAYYGHNGHTQIEYQLPNSKLISSFSIVNLEQDVPLKAKQKKGYGILPDWEIKQNLSDFLQNKDVVMEFVIKLIKESE